MLRMIRKLFHQLENNPENIEDEQLRNIFLERRRKKEEEKLAKEMNEARDLAPQYKPLEQNPNYFVGSETEAFYKPNMFSPLKINNKYKNKEEEKNLEKEQKTYNFLGAGSISPLSSSVSDHYSERSNKAGFGFYKSGGRISRKKLMSSYPFSHIQPDIRNSFKNGALVGNGDGQSDSIKGMLKEGTYILDATTVANIGNGSSEAGLEKLTHFFNNIERNLPLDKKQQFKIFTHRLKEVPVFVANQEFKISPICVLAIGNGSLALGKKRLDEFVKRIRLDKTSSKEKLPKPIKPLNSYFKKG